MKLRLPFYLWAVVLLFPAISKAEVAENHSHMAGGKVPRTSSSVIVVRRQSLGVSSTNAMRMRRLLSASVFRAKTARAARLAGQQGKGEIWSAKSPSLKLASKGIMNASVLPPSAAVRGVPGLAQLGGAHHSTLHESKSDGLGTRHAR